MEEESINEEQDLIVPEGDPEVEESAEQGIVLESAGSGERDTIDDGNDFRSLEERVSDLSLKDSSSTNQHTSSVNDHALTTVKKQHDGKAADFGSEQREQHGEKTEETKQMLVVEESVQLAPESAGSGENDTIDDGNDPRSLEEHLSELSLMDGNNQHTNSDHDHVLTTVKELQDDKSADFGGEQSQQHGENKQTLVVSPQETVHIVELFELLASEAIALDMAVEGAADDEIRLNLPPEELVELDEFLELEEEIARQLETERTANLGEVQNGISSSLEPPNKNHDFTLLGNFRVERRVEFPFQQERSEDAVATSSMQSSFPWNQECLSSTPSTKREGGNANQGQDLTDEENDHEFIMAVCNMAKIQRMFPHLFQDNLEEDQIHVVVDSKGNYRELYQSNIDEIAERYPELSQQLMVLEDFDAEEFGQNEVCTEHHETFEVVTDVLPTQMTFNDSVEIVNIPSEEDSAAEDILSVERGNEHGEETDDKTSQHGEDAKSDIVKCGYNPLSVSTQVTQENDNAKGNDEEYENTSQSDDEDFQHFLTWRDNFSPVLKEIKMLFSEKKHAGPLEFLHENNGSYSQNVTRNNNPQEPEEMPAATSNTLSLEEDVVQERSGATPNPFPMEESLMDFAIRLPREEVSAWEEAQNLIQAATLDAPIEPQEPLEGNIEPQALGAVVVVEGVEISLPLDMPLGEVVNFVREIFRENALRNHFRRERDGGESNEANKENEDG